MKNPRYDLFRIEDFLINNACRIGLQLLRRKIAVFADEILNSLCDLLPGEFYFRAVLFLKALTLGIMVLRAARVLSFSSAGNA